MSSNLGFSHEENDRDKRVEGNLKLVRYMPYKNDKKTFIFSLAWSQQKYILVCGLRRRSQTMRPMQTVPAPSARSSGAICWCQDHRKSVQRAPRKFEFVFQPWILFRLSLLLTSLCLRNKQSKNRGYMIKRSNSLSRISKKRRKKSQNCSSAFHLRIWSMLSNLYCSKVRLFIVQITAIT